LKLFQEWGKGRIKENGENFCKSHNVPTASTTIKKKKKKEKERV
jgi:hypothetical protein